MQNLFFSVSDGSEDCMITTSIQVCGLDGQYEVGWQVSFCL